MCTKCRIPVLIGSPRVRHLWLVTEILHFSTSSREASIYASLIVTSRCCLQKSLHEFCIHTHTHPRQIVPRKSALSYFWARTPSSPMQCYWIWINRISHWMVLILNLVVVTAARYYIYTKLWGGGEELMRMLETVGRSVEGNPFIPVGEVWDTWRFRFSEFRENVKLQAGTRAGWRKCVSGFWGRRRF